MSESAQQAIDEVRRRLREIETQLADSAVPVSYTHLTLPTSDLV